MNYYKDGNRYIATIGTLDFEPITQGQYETAMSETVERQKVQGMLYEKVRPLTAEEVTALLIKQQINTITVDDQMALRMLTFYPEWVDLIGKTVDKAEYKFQHNGKLYKTIPANHTFQADWIPGNGTAALYVRVDEAHAGTLADPIPAARSMGYTYGLYYSDQEDGKVYLCTRTGETAGGTITLHYMPHELVGLYFQEVTA